MKLLETVIGTCVATSLLSGATLAACDPIRKTIPASRYEMRGDEVLDKETGLTWQRCAVGQAWQDGVGCAGAAQEFTWSQAKKQAKGKWRLPTRDELSGLISFGCSPSINPDAFPNLDPVRLWYWSSTQDQKDLAWVVQFGGGATFNGFQTAPNAVRLVRDGR